MTERQFWIVTGLWTLILALSASPAGAIGGFAIGIGVAFFIAPLLWMTGAMETGLVETYAQAPFYLALCVAAGATIWALYRAQTSFDLHQEGRNSEARALFARGYRMAAIPWAVLLCCRSITLNWTA